MLCIAIILAFFNHFTTPGKEECAEVFTEYLLEQGCEIKEGISSEDLETAKQQFKKTFVKWNFEAESALLSLSELDIYKINHENVSDYFSLPVTHHEEKLIHKIISTLAEKNVFALLFEKKDLQKKGKQIEHLHPLRFLGTIFSNSHLRHAMKEVKKSSFKWDGFMDGLTPRMKEEASRDNLVRYIPGFAAHVHADPEKVHHYIRHRNWDGLVRSLL